MRIKLTLSGLYCLFALTSYGQKKQASLVPLTPSQAPDYFCTWNIQGYVGNYKSSVKTRQEMLERNIFGDRTYEGWGKQFAKIHSDLYLVLDDDWETPLNGDKSYYGSLIVDDERFPSVKGLSPEQKLTSLSNKTKSFGWKGLGLWICAQQAPRYTNTNNEAYWTERFNWMNKAGIGYWKVDWGNDSKSAEWRAALTVLGKKIAPNLIIEQAMTPTAMTTAEVYRTYDVENIIAVPHTIDRIAKLLTALPKGKAVSIINCEDEPYIAAGTGSAIGIMRHAFNGNLPNGKPDHAFPAVGRDLKNRMDEVVRAVMWHRIASPFGINKTDFYIDTVQLHDYWLMKDNETWMTGHGEGYRNAFQAPAVITRGLEKPLITLKKGDTLVPYILASKYPNGAIAIASIGRTIGREYLTPRADVIIKVAGNTQPFGIFGHYNSLTLQVEKLTTFTKVLAQDLAGNTPTDITNQIFRKGNKITIPGTVIDKIGLSAGTNGDKSEPGLVLVFKK
ncbi:MAG: hypothetical protein H7289_04530 [Mucilaginibacter sp.]|nr:hypothetical protein [Mucilaginibacter sp.]